VRRRLSSHDRLILVTDGIVERRTDTGVFGVEGIRDTLAGLQAPTAAATAMALLRAVAGCWRDPLEDDATVVVLRVS
jgi:serine phosphatase RsbU (regulator of sigma subunit)